MLSKWKYDSQSDTQIHIHAIYTNSKRCTWINETNPAKENHLALAWLYCLRNGDRKGVKHLDQTFGYFAYKSKMVAHGAGIDVLLIITEVFGGVCVCCPLVFEFSVGIGGFVIGLGQISFFFSLQTTKRRLHDILAIFFIGMEEW